MRRLFNQAFFKKIVIYDDGHVETELAEPLATLLCDTIRALAETDPDVPNIII